MVLGKLNIPERFKDRFTSRDVNELVRKQITVKLDSSGNLINPEDQAPLDELNQLMASAQIEAGGADPSSSRTVIPTPFETLINWDAVDKWLKEKGEALLLTSLVITGILYIWREIIFPAIERKVEKTLGAYKNHPSYGPLIQNLTYGFDLLRLKSKPVRNLFTFLLFVFLLFNLIVLIGVLSI
jgi:hypothetical protein